MDHLCTINLYPSSNHLMRSMFRCSSTCLACEIYFDTKIHSVLSILFSILPSLILDQSNLNLDFLPSLAVHQVNNFYQFHFIIYKILLFFLYIPIFTNLIIIILPTNLLNMPPCLNHLHKFNNMSIVLKDLQYF